MIGSTRRVRVHVHGRPTDMRKSFDTLAALVSASKHDVLAGDLFLFVGKDNKRAKVLFFDGTGLCVYAKRLSRGTFGNIFKRSEITHSELALFLEGSTLAAREPLSPGALGPEDLFLRKDAFS